MWITRPKVAGAAFAVAAGLVGSGLLDSPVLADKPHVVAQEPKEPAARPLDKAHQAAKLDLTPESFANLRLLIRPHENEWRHLKVQWLTDVVAVRQKATAEDKPIIICYTGGAGYNEPLGIC